MEKVKDLDEMFNEEEFLEDGEMEQGEEIEMGPAHKAPAKKAAPVAKVNNDMAAVSDDFEIGFTDEMVQSLNSVGITSVDIGTRVSNIPLEKYRANSDKTDRIAFLTQKVIPIKYHYIDGHGSILCDNKTCCKMLDEPSVRYLFPICVYQTDTDGRVTGRKIELKILSASAELYKNIITIHNGLMPQGGITHTDLLVTCSDTQYQKLALIPCGAPLWRRSSNVAQFLADKWKEHGSEAYKAIAKRVSPEVFKKWINADETDANQSFNSVTNQDLDAFFS